MRGEEKHKIGSFLYQGADLNGAKKKEKERVWSRGRSGQELVIIDKRHKPQSRTGPSVDH